MPSVSKKQHNFMAAIAKNPKFAKKVGVPSSVGEDFLEADKGKKFRSGSTTSKKAGINNPRPNHGKIQMPNYSLLRYAGKKEGGVLTDNQKEKDMKHSDISKDMPMMKKVAGQAVKGHEKRMHKMAGGGVTRADGCVTKGHTKGKMIKMNRGGAC
jgi:hypothetical protein